MAKTLHVYLNQKQAGQLVQNEGGQLEFTYLKEYLNDSQAIPLSFSLPLRSEMFTVRECRGYFSGILPEEVNREIIAKNLGITPRNDFSMLKEIGGECAGAVSFFSEPIILPTFQHAYRSLSEQELASVIERLPQRPLLAGETGVRLSLAGAQAKLAVWVDGNTLAIPLYNSPSSHILKPASKYFEGLVYNEAFCMMLAALCGLATANVEIRQTRNEAYLLIERYDRNVFFKDNSPRLERLHQEDFCQALGILSQHKYQKEGGPSLQQCFELVTKNSRVPLLDRQKLLDAVIFNFLIGNNDAHGKNFSFTYLHDGNQVIAQLAPLYDLVCTAFYPTLDINMAMKMGDKSLLSKIKWEHFKKMAEETSLAKPFVKKRLQQLTQQVLDNIPNVPLENPVAQGVASWIQSHCQEVLGWF